MSHSPPGCVISPEAFTKSLFHCLRYSTQPCCGFLVGKRLGNGGKEGASTSSSSDSALSVGSLYVADAVPLLHTQCLSPRNVMLEVAAVQVQAELRTRGLQIVGIYVAPEFSPSPSSSSGGGNSAYLKEREIVLRGAQSLLHDHLPKASSSSPFLFVEFQNNLFSTFFSDGSAEGNRNALSLVHCYAALPSHATDTEQRKASLSFGRWDGNVCDTVAVDPFNVTDSMNSLMDRFVHETVVDFEDHLQQVQLNYLTQVLN